MAGQTACLQGHNIRLVSTGVWASGFSSEHNQINTVGERDVMMRGIVEYID
jgi:hypothetical protein